MVTEVTRLPPGKAETVSPTAARSAAVRGVSRSWLLRCRRATALSRVDPAPTPAPERSTWTVPAKTRRTGATMAEALRRGSEAAAREETRRRARRAKNRKQKRRANVAAGRVGFWTPSGSPLLVAILGTSKGGSRQARVLTEGDPTWPAGTEVCIHPDRVVDHPIVANVEDLHTWLLVEDLWEVLLEPRGIIDAGGTP